MAAPGSLAARFDRLTGGPDRRAEFYVARRRLGYSWDEWESMPWWQRRAYVEGLRGEAEARIEAQQPRTGATGLDSLYGGTMADVKAAGFGG